MLLSETTTEIGKALAAANLEIESIAKDSTNPHFRSKYASLDAIMAAVRPILARHGLSVLQGASDYGIASDGGMRVTGFSVDTRVLHVSGEWIGSKILMPVSKSDPQGVGSALTYGRRYGISALLALATDEDDDANSAMPPREQANPSQRYASNTARQQFGQPSGQTGGKSSAQSSGGDQAPLSDLVDGALTQVAKALRQSVKSVSCPECSGEMWDNRATKSNPKAPDYKCKKCGHAVWANQRQAKAPKTSPEMFDQPYEPDGFEREDYDIPF